MDKKKLEDQKSKKKKVCANALKQMFDGNVALLLTIAKKKK